MTKPEYYSEQELKLIREQKLKAMKLTDEAVKKLGLTVHPRIAEARKRLEADKRESEGFPRMTDRLK